METRNRIPRRALWRFVLVAAASLAAASICATGLPAAGFPASELSMPAF
jgi:hypothetical protein